jgi:lipopolysaccharide/colanic/teichoic acid biosynthesis glycosyltransferase
MSSSPSTTRTPDDAASAAPRLQSRPTRPTLWGLRPVQIYDRYWAARGVQVVRQSESSEIVDDAELFLLTDRRSLVVFRLTLPVENLTWVRPQLLYLRLHDHRPRTYRESVVTDPHGRFVRFERSYGAQDPQLARVALTTSRHLAHLWQMAPSTRAGWRLLRQLVEPNARATMSLPGRVFDASNPRDLAEGLSLIQQRWKRPDSTIRRIRRHSHTVWSDREAAIDAGCKFVGTVWVGAGRRLSAAESVVGPAILWDDPKARPEVDGIRWDDIEPISQLDRAVTPRRLTSSARISKRLLDLTIASVALVLTLPLYPLIMLAIWLEDGRPFFFVHWRETLGGREFPCVKFRSMKNNAEQIKQRLLADNQADGPQFFMDNDPRLTRVGRLLRNVQLDEIPQFFNILLGHMSAVGPRPSPYSENQFCPPWREARLSVRPGLTGLWQVCRTRRQGLDFQEWIRYDIEYVENVSPRLDAWILWRTFVMVLKGVFRR